MSTPLLQDGELLTENAVAQLLNDHTPSCVVCHRPMYASKYATNYIRWACPSPDGFIAFQEMEKFLRGNTQHYFHHRTLTFANGESQVQYKLAITNWLYQDPKDNAWELNCSEMFSGRSLCFIEGEGQLDLSNTEELLELVSLHALFSQ